MRRAVSPLLVVGCALGLLLVCFRAVLFGGEQFAFRDAPHFYYPLYLRVQQEWQAGRWPLWDPWQNGGQPLLGSPMAAVLYPGKVIYALVPYAWGARLYVVGHTVLAFLGMLALSRSLGVSWVGAGLSGMSYAFGAPVLFQYSNVIYLVGAAWVPWGLRAVDRLVRRRKHSGLIELSVVLAMQMLGGDLQAAYLMVLCGAGYAVLLALRGRSWPSWFSIRPLVLALPGVWIVATPVFAFCRPSIPGWVGSIWVPAVLAWGVAGVWVFRRWRRRPEDRLGPRLAVLSGAAVLALALSAAQLLPVAEFAGRSSRLGAARSLTLSKFSMEPYRLVECVWPGVFGARFPENRTWIQAIPPANDRQLWQHSLYVGGLAVLLFLGAAGFRGGPPWRAWLTSIALVSLAASFGRFGSPLWWVRWLPGLESALGPHDPLFGLIRTDAFLEDGAGSPYALLAAVLPGFGLFRYSSKLLTLTAASVAVLAGSGWDEVMAGRSKWLARGSAVGLVASAGGLALALVFRARVVAFLSDRLSIDELAGPPNAPGAWAETQRALAHGMLIYAMGLGLARWGPSRPRRAGALVLLTLAVDLGVANSRLIWTAPQSVFDGRPEVARRIEEAERAEPSPGPFRVHRMSLWHPERFLEQRSPGRVRELTDWEHETLQGLDGLPLGLEECLSAGALELDDVLTFFRPKVLPAVGETAQALKVAPGRPLYYYPRRSYDLFGARYFLLPVRPDGWATASRGYASFVPDTEIVAPGGGEAGRARWAGREDWQLVRNKAAYPRAWVVHYARILAPATDPEARTELIDNLVFQNDPFWSDPRRPVANLRTMAWIETGDREALRGSISLSAVAPDESATVTRHEPQRVVVKARLNRPGLVILADTYYPGWRLTIDERPAPIFRANRILRGAAVPAGDHTLIYVYDPWSFRIGRAVSLLGLAALLWLIARQSWRGLRGRWS